MKLNIDYTLYLVTDSGVSPNLCTSMNVSKKVIN